MVHKVGLQLDLVLHDNGDILMVRTHLSVIFCLFVLPSWLIFFLITEEIIWFGEGGFLLVHKGFSIAGRFAYSADMFLKIKTVCLHVVIPEMHSFSMRFAKYFYDKPLSKTLIQKLSYFIVCTLYSLAWIFFLCDFYLRLHFIHLVETSPLVPLVMKNANFYIVVPSLPDAVRRPAARS